MKIEVWYSTGYVGGNQKEIIEVEDDLDEEDLNQIAEDWFYNRVNYGWDVVE